jgi:nitrite reductase/ring-hydroxylating ferredoxin subunit
VPIWPYALSALTGQGAGVLSQSLTTSIMNSVSTSSSRRVHGRLVIAVAVVALAATTMLLANVFNESSSPGPSWVRAGSVSEFQGRQVVYVPEARAFVIAASSTSPLALYARSPHLGERVRYCASSGWFEDRAHGAMFDGLGRYVLGPAPRGLDRFEARVIDGDVWVDTANVMLGPPRGSGDPHPSGPFCSSQ